MSKETEAGCGAVAAPVERPVRLDPERAAFEAWMSEPVAAGEDPAPWIDGLAAEAAWQAWKHRGTEIDRLEKNNARLRRVIRAAIALANNSIQTRSRDINDWSEDMQVLAQDLDRLLGIEA